MVLFFSYDAFPTCNWIEAATHRPINSSGTDILIDQSVVDMTCRHVNTKKVFRQTTVAARPIAYYARPNKETKTEEPNQIDQN